MFVKAVEKASGFTRPFMSISRAYGHNDINRSCATLIIVNDEGWVLTCKHVAEEMRITELVNKQYANFKAELGAIPKTDNQYKAKVKALEKRYGYEKRKLIRIQQKNHLVDIVDQLKQIEWYSHPKYDIALIHLEGYNKILCDQYPVFAQDASALKIGKSLCRLGYPYPEFSNYKYDETSDDIVWTDDGRKNTPMFPIEGMMTRPVIDEKGRVFEIELSTPGLRGQSGGPLFDENGIVYGVQSRTVSLHLGFDVEDKEIIVNHKMKKVDNYPFLHLGRCVHVDIIKDFMDARGVKYQVG